MSARIYFDAMLFVYFIEDNAEFGPRVRQIRQSIKQRKDTLCTSVFTVGEVLAGPYKRGANELVSLVRELLRPPHVELIPFDINTAIRYAKIRSSCRATPADAIHLASAAESQVSLFLTNDRQLTNLVVPGIDFIAGLDVNLF